MSSNLPTQTSGADESEGNQYETSSNVSTFRNYGPMASPRDEVNILPGATPPMTHTDLPFGSTTSQGDFILPNGGSDALFNSGVGNYNNNNYPRFGGSEIPSINPSNPLIERNNTRLPNETSAEGVDNSRIRVIWGTNIIISEAISSFKSFIFNFTLAHRKMMDARSMGNSGHIPISSAEDLEPVYPKLLQQIRETEIYNLNLDCANLASYPPTTLLSNQLNHYPVEIIQLMDMAVNECFMELFPEVNLDQDSIQVRPFNTGKVVNMRELNPTDLDKLISIKGLVIRVSNIIPDMRVAYFICSACNQTHTVESIRGNISEPSKCPRSECNALHSLSLVHNKCIFADKQLIKIQETPDSIPDGQTPHCVTLCVYDGLVDVARPGDRVEVTGVFRSSPVRVNSRQRRVKSLFRTYIDVVHLKRSDKNKLKLGEDTTTEMDFLTSFDENDGIEDLDNEMEEKIAELSRDPDLYNKLFSSLAPNVWGHENVKKGLLLQLFGGVSKVLKNSNLTRFRGDINILLAGDPGVSKSQLLQYVHKLAPRGIYTSGKGSSAVGLTAYITRDAESNQLVLESGALVLSDGGVCCIDEFDKMSDETRSILHEVMEQQTVSIAKAGIITTLNARTSILASANPIDSKYNPSKSIVENLNLPPTILSRFDLIYLILDKCSVEEDQKLGRHIVALYTQNGQSGHTQNILEPSLLAKYISRGRNLQPVLSEEAIREISNGYVAMRKLNGSGKTVSATTRQLDSIVRLSEAHAKMRLSSVIEVKDVHEAIRLIREAMLSYAVDPLTGRIDMDLISTGKSSAFRERQTELKKAIKVAFETGGFAQSVDFSSLFTLVNSNSSIPINEKWLRLALEELAEEEYVWLDKSRPTITIHRN